MMTSKEENKDTPGSEEEQMKQRLAGELTKNCNLRCILSDEERRFMLPAINFRFFRLKNK